MKTKIIKITLLACIALGISCSSSSDEEIISVKPELFMKQMVSTTPGSATETITFDYDVQKRISNFTVARISDTYSYGVIYTDNLISTINATLTNSSGTNVIQFNFTYTTGKLATMSIGAPGTVGSVINFTYDSALRRYTGVFSGGTFVTFDLDENLDISHFDYNSEQITINHNTNSGVFKENSNCIPMFLTSLFANGTTKYAAQFFSSKEITTMANPSITLTATTLRNENNQIGGINFFNGTNPSYDIDVTYVAIN